MLLLVAISTVSDHTGPSLLIHGEDLCIVHQSVLREDSPALVSRLPLHQTNKEERDINSVFGVKNNDLSEYNQCYTILLVYILTCFFFRCLFFLFPLLCFLCVVSGFSSSVKPWSFFIWAFSKKEIFEYYWTGVFFNSQSNLTGVVGPYFWKSWIKT